MQEQKRTLLGTAWLNVSRVNRLDYRLFKIIEVREEIEGFEETTVSYELERVPEDKLDAAFGWLKKEAGPRGYQPYGVFYTASPGLIWTKIPEKIAEASRLGIPAAEMRQHSSDLDLIREVLALFVGGWAGGQLPNADFVYCPHIHFSPRKGADSSWNWPYLTSTRSRAELWRLRSQFPRAGELLWEPMEVLEERFGQGLGGQVWTRAGAVLETAT